MSDRPTPQRPALMHYKPLHQIDRLADLYDHPEFKRKIAQAIPAHLNPERMIRTFTLAVARMPKLAQASIPSLIGAFLSCSALGLEPNTALQHAYLIPFEIYKWNPQTRQREYARTDVNLVIGYRGYIDLIYRGGKVKDIHCDVVWPGDEFSYEFGSSQHLRHKRAGTADHSGEPDFAYMYARLNDGGEVFEVMTKAEVHALRARSQGFQTAMKAYDDARSTGKDPAKDKRYSDAPWIRDPVAMWRKTALRAGQKYLPQSIEIATAMMMDEERARFDRIDDASHVLDGIWAETAPEEEDIEEIPPDLPESPPTSPPTSRAPRKQSARNTAPLTPIEPPGSPDEVPPDDRWGAPDTPYQPPSTEEYVLFDKWGDPANDRYTDPVVYARALLDLLNQTENQAEVDAILEFNGTGIEAATRDAQAARVLELLKTMTAEANPPLDLGSPDWPGVLQQSREALRALSPATLDDWLTGRITSFIAAPVDVRLQFIQMVSDRAVQMGIGIPPKLTTLQPRADNYRMLDASDPLAELYRRAIVELEGCGDFSALVAWSKGASVAAIISEAAKLNRPDLTGLLKESYNVRARRLGVAERA